jgi:hypothetical protein
VEKYGRARQSADDNAHIWPCNVTKSEICVNLFKITGQMSGCVFGRGLQ